MSETPSCLSVEAGKEFFESDFNKIHSCFAPRGIIVFKDKKHKMVALEASNFDKNQWIDNYNESKKK